MSTGEEILNLRVNIEAQGVDEFFQHVQGLYADAESRARAALEAAGNTGGTGFAGFTDDFRNQIAQINSAAQAAGHALGIPTEQITAALREYSRTFSEGITRSPELPTGLAENRAVNVLPDADIQRAANNALFKQISIQRAQEGSGDISQPAADVLAAAENTRRLAEDPAFIQANTKLSTAKNDLSTKLNDDRAKDAEFSDSAAELARSQNAEAAAIAAAKAGNDAYLKSLAERSTSENDLSAAETEALALNRRYLDSLVGSTTAQNAREAIEKDTLSRSALYLESLELKTLSGNNLAAAELEQLAGSRTYLDSTARIAKSRDELATKEADRANNADNILADATRALSEERLKQAELAKELELTDSKLIAVQAANEAEQTRQRVARNLLVEQDLANPADVAAAAQADFARRRNDLARQSALTQLENAPEVIDQRGAQAAQVSLTQAYRQLAEAAAIEEFNSQQLARGEADYYAILGSARAARETENAAVRAAADAELAASSQFAVSGGKGAAAKEEIAARQKLVQILTDQGADEATILATLEESSGAEIEQRVAVEQRLSLEKDRIARLRATLDNESQEATLTAERKLLDKQVNDEINLQLKQLIAQGVESGSIAQGNLLQQIRFRANQANPNSEAALPTELEGSLGFAGQAFGGIAQFLPALIAFQAIGSIRGLIADTESLQTALLTLKGEFISTDQAAAFPQFRDSVLQIARSTGTAATEVAQLGILIKGAFGDSATSAKELEATVVGIKTNVFTQEDAANVGVAISKSFGIPIEQITDEALHLRDVFGVSAHEIAAGVATVGPVLQDAGLSYRQGATLIAAAAQDSGRTAQAIAEAFGRVLPQIPKNGIAIIQTLKEAGLTSAVTEVEQELAQGNYGQTLVTLSGVWGQLTKSEQTYLDTTLGGSRQAQVIIAALSNSSKFLQEYADTSDHAGETQRNFAEIQKGLSQEIARTGEAFKQLGQELLRAGVASVFSHLLETGSALINMLAGFLKLLGDLNGATGGWAGKLAEAVGALLVMQKILSALSDAAILKTITSLFGGALARGAGEPSLLSLVGAGKFTGEAAPAVEGPPSGGVFAGLGATLGSLAPTAALVATIAAGVTYVQNRNSVDAAAKSAAAQISQESDAQVAELARSHNDFFAGVGLALFGAPSVADIAKRVQRQRAALPDALKLDTGTTSLKNLAGGLDLTKIVPPEFIKEISDLASGAPGTYAIDLPSNVDPVNVAKDIKEAAKNAAGFAKFLIALQSGNSDAKAAADLILTQITNNPSANAAFNASQQSALVKAVSDQQKASLTQYLTSTKDSAGKAIDPQSITDANALNQAYQNGQISLGDFLTQTQSIADTYKALASYGPLAPDQAKAYAALLGLISKTKAGSINTLDDLRISVTGSNPADAATAYADAQGALGDALDSGNTQTALAAAQTLIKRAKDKLDADLSGVNDAATRAAIIAKDSKFDPATLEKLALVFEALSPAFQTVQETLAAFPDLQHSIAAATAAQIAQGKAGADALLAADEAQLTLLQTALDTLTNEADQYGLNSGLAQNIQHIEGEINALQGAINAAQANSAALNSQLSTPGGVGAPNDNSSGLAASNALAKALANGDPIQQDLLDIQAAQDALSSAKAGSDTQKQAQADLINAQNKYNDDLAAIGKSRLELAKALVSGDPVQAAQIADQIAAEAITTAKGEAAKLQAEADKLNADRTMQEAINAVGISRLNLAKALAQAAGDDVLAAQDQVGILQQEIADLKSLPGGVDQAKLNDLYGQLALAQAQVTQTYISTTEKAIQDQLDLGEITKAQAVSELTGLLAAAKTQGERDEILLEIKRLRDSTSNLQFDIPTDITLPTLYEARRLNETPAGSAYNDNRNVNINLNVYGNQDMNAAMVKVLDAVGGPTSRTHGATAGLF